MRHEEVSQILLSPQFAHDLGDGQFRKNTLGLQTQRQEIGEHFDQQSVYRPSPCSCIEWIWKIDFMIFQKHSMT